MSRELQVLDNVTDIVLGYRPRDNSKTPSRRIHPPTVFSAKKVHTSRPTFYEFFAGGGMARGGLGAKWHCTFANDFNEMKAEAYRANWGDGDLLVGDVNHITTDDLPGQADLAWASFPCQDLSLAGNYEGIGNRAAKKKTRSGTFWPFWGLMRNLGNEHRSPRIIVLENVYGALSSNNGQDFAAIASAFSGANYRFGAMIVDAALFLPHSRPRLFIVGVRSDVKIPSALKAAEPSAIWHPSALFKAFELLSAEAKRKWVWWDLPEPERNDVRLVDLIEDKPTGVRWHNHAETANLLGMMNERHIAKVESAKKAGHRMVGGVYKRTRTENGIKACRAEVRFDDLAGCLRTPTGGSSRQSIVVVEGNKVRSRLLSTREAARLMGLPDDYKLPDNYNDAYHLSGDGVVLPVVRHLASNLLEPILTANGVTVSAHDGE